MPILKLFSKSDLRVLDEVVAKYGDKKFYDLYQITHRHFAYTWEIVSKTVSALRPSLTKTCSN